MDLYLLPSTKYESPKRQARQTLNTIIEDEFSESEAGGQEIDNSRRGRDSINMKSVVSTSPVPSFASSMSSYYQKHRRSQEFDDLYDVSDDDSMTDIEEGDTPPLLGSPTPTQNDSHPKEKNRYPTLVIPSPGQWPTIQKLHALTPIRPPKIPISPAVLALLSPDFPMTSNPPSLAGSITDPMAGSTAPATPDSQIHPLKGEQWGQGSVTQFVSPQDPEQPFYPSTPADVQIRIDDTELWDESGSTFEEIPMVCDTASNQLGSRPDSPLLGSEDGYSEIGVQLPAGALETLQSLASDLRYSQASTPVDEVVGEMQEVPMHMLPSPKLDATPTSEISDYSIAQLSIPSPGGFFSSLGENASHTWAIHTNDFSLSNPPSSTTAEQFYSYPWNKDSHDTVERIVEIDDDGTEGPPTARQVPPTPSRDQPSQQIEQAQPVGPVDMSEDYDDDYEQALKQVSSQSLDRTSSWLAAQTSYMAVLRETNPANDLNDCNHVESKRPKLPPREDTTYSMDPRMKKAVKFLERVTVEKDLGPATASGSDSIFYHAYQHIKHDTKPIDSFRHQQTRYDALQTSRICQPKEHQERILGCYQITTTDRPSHPRPISTMWEKKADEETAEQKVIAKVERERQALEQVGPTMWILEAARYLDGGELLKSPVVDILKNTPSEDVVNHVRILDLGGHADCGWAWSCSLEYTNVSIYTATLDSPKPETSLRGPRNHATIVISKLWELPFPTGHFDTISARTLFSDLKAERPNGEKSDEYDLCLRECLRCLKPGGYLEFSMMDAELVNSGSRGSALSVEFGFNLKVRGYDPNPTKSWLGRLRRAGFNDIKRAWTFLPMGSAGYVRNVMPETPPPNVSTHDPCPIDIRGCVGSTANVAGVTGLVGSSAWEQWMLKLHMEMGKENALDGVAAVLEEGKSTGAGWRCLSGWARKPLEGSDA